MRRAEVRLGWKTQPGHRHRVEGRANEDAVYVTADHPAFDALLLVADGMGGHPRPGEASAAAVQAALDTLAGAGAEDPPAAASAALQAAARAVQALRAGDGRREPGTTLTVALIAAGVLHVGHVGDGSILLLRAGRLGRLAGGEERRAGNRPDQFLGQELPLEPEWCRIPLAEGDRLLLCTDGLTRYFQEAGEETLARVLGRQGVDVQSIAGQLTAHSRPDEYDDDTTVAVAEVVSLREVAEPAPGPRPKGTRPAEGGVPVPADLAPRRAGRGAMSFLSGALVGSLLLAAGFVAGRVTAPLEPAAPPASPTGAAAEPRTDPEALKHLPAGSLVLVDALGGRLFALSAGTQAPAAGPLDVQALRAGPGGRLVDAGRFRLDPARGELTDSRRRTYPAEIDAARGLVRVLRGGVLTVRTRPAGARVYIDGRERGPSPQTMRLPEGRRRVRVTGRSWSAESEIDIVAGRGTTLELAPQ